MMYTLIRKLGYTGNMPYPCFEGELSCLDRILFILEIKLVPLFCWRLEFGAQPCRLPTTLISLTYTTCI